MAEKKPGFFGRLFGKKEAPNHDKAAETATEAQESIKAELEAAKHVEVEQPVEVPPEVPIAVTTNVPSSVPEPEAPLGAHAAQAGPEATIDAAVAPNGATPAPPPDSNRVDAMQVDQPISEPEDSVIDASSNATGGKDENGGGAGDGSSATGGGKKEKNWFQRLTSGLKKVFRSAHRKHCVGFHQAQVG